MLFGFHWSRVSNSREIIFCIFICIYCGQDDEEEQQAAKSKSKKSNKNQKKTAFNPFDQIETGGAGGDDGAAGGDDDYNPFADFMAGVSTGCRHWHGLCALPLLKGRRHRGRREK